MFEKLPVAFVAGLLSVITPCVLPLVPGYLSAVSAVEVEHLGERGSARRVVIASIPFIAGFSAVFVVLGAAAAAVAGQVDKTTQTEIAGFILVVLGLAFVGLLPWPERVMAPGLVHRARRSGSAALLGGAFAVVAAPASGRCSPRSSSLASSSGGVARGVILLLAYSLGLGAAFVVAGVAFAHAMRTFRWIRSHYQALRIASGVDPDHARPPALLQPRLVAADRARPALRAARAHDLLTAARPVVSIRWQAWRESCSSASISSFGRSSKRCSRTTRLLTSEGIDPPDLVLADVGRVDPDDVADTFPDVPLLGFTNHKDTEGLRRAHAAGFDRVIVKSALFERPGELIDGLLAPVE